MAIRIIAGEFGGRWVKTPDGAKTHPMGERERAAIFNALVDDLAGAKVLDLFAGSGALGLEALSRGAEAAVFVEKARAAGEVISENIAALGVEQRAILYKMPAKKMLQMGEKFDVIFADPPYSQPQWSTIQELGQMMNAGGKLVISFQKGTNRPLLAGFTLCSTKVYAGAAIDILEKTA
ncbi:MAG: 16S rRNA (guanine(966)-N(2))-methyltransferase RsmD [Candidatus Nomurabacteria bacterium]|jgi:16S rRNA (guanine966-N2)-methyltransferase|nr:16S rRNA (guanine(966)-N(2))-methyltransferase RsmD [Candidatus Nomurabacteria bacterium]